MDADALDQKVTVTKAYKMVSRVWRDDFSHDFMAKHLFNHKGKSLH